MPNATLKELEAVTAPINSARGLPNGFYTDPAVFEAEKRVLFAANWACIGFVKDLAVPGAAHPVSFLGQPLLMVRDQQDNIRVFQNVCRHRGMILVDEPTTLRGTIRCPYHSWCYNFDGSLRTTPHVGGPGKNLHECIDREELGLLEVRSAVWMGLVFVNLDAKAPEFDDAFADLKTRWHDFAERALFHGGAASSFMLEVQCNWKLAVENYCESYHLPWVHPGLNSYSRLEDHYNIVEKGKFSGQGTLVYNPNLEADGKTLSLFEGLSSKWDNAAEYIAVYPNVLLGVHKDHTFAILLDPQSHDRTIERIEVFYADDTMADEAHLPLRKAHQAMWKEVFQEDIFVVEGMQRGRAADLFDGGKFSPVMDEATHCFHDWVARQFSQPHG